jgi:hypothetical protein
MTSLEEIKKKIVEQFEKNFQLTDYALRLKLRAGSKLKGANVKEIALSFWLSKLDEVYQLGVEGTEKAYGGCKKCYGKGYATVRYGLKYVADFEGDKDYIDPIKTHMHFCSCDRGKQLKNLINQLKSKRG